MIQFIDYLKGESYVSGKEMLKRGGSDMAGKEDLEYYQSHPELLKDYKDKYLLFPEYRKLYSGGGRFVAYLFWVGDSWVLYWHWLDDVFLCRALLVRARTVYENKVKNDLPDKLIINGIIYERKH